ncbi:MAG: DeoR/GlpR transcriptional regulator [Fusobacteriaceae bacterium]|jgi:DeoR family transcriptional regulator, fructose operon transcriptional repressor|nr:DeoR/GlpR transcriptional regulator [Fusobacteriaceae bacterium]MBN2839313.1 DeoR/GlpR transcriptional regulator [Fusobacteriaceae bacterium]
MLTSERKRIILENIRSEGSVKLKELMELTNSSESTIRRDLNDLENKGLIVREHGGAALRNNYEESVDDKSTLYTDEKEEIGKYAASLVQNGDCIFLDAGTTIFHIIKYLENKDILVVTNGINHLEELKRYNIRTYLTGGLIKFKTKALIGRETIKTLVDYNFDKCFLGVNSISLEKGYTTPDPEEAFVKSTAKDLSKKVYVLADYTKFGKVSFAKIASLEEAIIITDKVQKEYSEKTEIKVVK